MQDSALDRFRDTLTRAGVKLTPQRIEIFRELAGSKDHPDAETVFERVRRRMPSVSLDTVYRTLWLFLELGLISTLSCSRQRVRFDGNASAHHHFVCRSCGRIIDIFSPQFDSLIVPGSLGNVGKVERIQVEVRGLCSQCLPHRGSNHPMSHKRKQELARRKENHR